MPLKKEIKLFLKPVYKAAYSARENLKLFLLAQLSTASR